MSTQQIVDNVRASFAMEGLHMTKQDEEYGKAILDGTADIENVIKLICNKYTSKEIVK